MDITAARALPEMVGLDDDQIVDVFHQAYYPDLPRERVAASLGIKPAAAPTPSATWTDRAKDTGISLLKGAVAVPEAAVGIADLATGGKAGQLAESAGFRPKEAKEALSEGYSPAQKHAFEQVQHAEGLWDTFKAAVTHPSTVIQSIAESAPSMVAGGAVARGGMALLPKMGPVMAGAAGEGVVQAGSAAEAARQESPDGTLSARGAGAAVTSGVIDTVIARFSGGLAKKLGIADVDTMLAGAAVNPKAAKGVVRSALQGMLTEGLLEELPQSVQEQVLANYAAGRALDEGVNQAAVLGTLSGAAMGGGANVLNSLRAKPTVDDVLGAPDVDSAIKAATGAVQPPSAPEVVAPPVDNIVGKPSLTGTSPADLMQRPDEFMAAARAPRSITGTTAPDLFTGQPQDPIQAPALEGAAVREDQRQNDMASAAVDNMRREVDQEAQGMREYDPLTLPRKEPTLPAIDEAIQAGDIIQKNGAPWPESGARLKLKTLKGGGTLIPVQGGFIVRPTKGASSEKDPDLSGLPGRGASAGATADLRPAEPAPAQRGAGAAAVAPAQGIDAAAAPSGQPGAVADGAGAARPGQSAPAVQAPGGVPAGAAAPAPPDVRPAPAPPVQSDGVRPAGRNDDAAQVRTGSDAAAGNGAAVAIGLGETRPGDGQRNVAPADDGRNPDDRRADQARAAEEVDRGEVVSRFTGKYGKGMTQPAAKLKAREMNKASNGTTYTAEEHGDAKLEHPWGVVGRAKIVPRNTEQPNQNASKPLSAKEKITAAPAKNRETISPAEPASSAVAVPQKLFVQRGTKRFEVADLKEASQKWQTFQAEAGAGVSEVGNGVTVVDQDGKEVASISYNGRVWPPGGYKSGTAPLLEADGSPGKILVLGAPATEQPRDPESGQFVEAEKDAPLLSREQAGRDSTTDLTIYQMAQDGNTASAMLEHIASESKVPFFRELAAALQRAGIDPTISTDLSARAGLRNVNGRAPAAMYEPNDDAVYLWTPRFAERHLLHELTHAATTHAIRAKTPNALRMRGLYDYVKKSGIDPAQYGMTSLDEFVAEAFTNDSFQEALRAIPSERRKNAWEWLVDVVRQILGLTKQDATALEDVLKTGSVLMRENAVQLPGGALAASQGPLFYSALARAVATFTGKSLPAEGWRGQIQSWINKGLVKQDEVEWTGLRDWVDLQRGRVTKENVAQYLEQNGVKVQEIQKGGRERPDEVPDGWTFEQDDIGNWSVLDEDGEVRGEGGTRGLAKNDALNNIEGEAPTKYGQYQLPGGTNYKELLLTLPTVRGALTEEQQSRLEYLRHRKTSGAFDMQSGQLAEELKRLESTARGTEYRSSHWDEPNVLAHIRFNERTDADGKRVLFVEEIQSDWAQEGKKKGFIQAAPDLGDRITIKPRENDLGGFNAYVDGQFTAHGATEAEARERANTMSAKLDKNFKVPSAPFVGKTDAWVSLAIKRMISYASENGFDKVAFVNGEQSAERYDLSKQISRVRWTERIPSRKGTLSQPPTDGTLEAWDTDGKRVMSQVIEAKYLPDHIGKEVAQRLMEKEATPDPISRNVGYSTRELSGIDLKVGGEGMKTFYDSIVPKVAKDVLRKVGGAGLTTVELQIPGQREGDRDAVTGATIGPNGTAGANFDAVGFAITDQMRQKASDGLPLFAQDENLERIALLAKKNPQAWARALPRAGDIVDGLVVRDHVPNMDSIAASITKPRVLAGIREVPLAAFDYDPGTPSQRVIDLAEQIQESDEINPLIVGVDDKGPYIIEGGHRLDALLHLKAKSLPAIVVLDEDALGPTPMFAQDDEPSEPTPSGAAASKLLESMTIDNVRKHAGYKFTDYRTLGLGFLGRRQITELYSRYLPELASYNELVQQMDADKNEEGAAADQVARDWGKLKDERQLAELMHDATLAQIDPAKDHYVTGDSQEDYDALRTRWQALSPEAQATYTKARDMYEEHYARVREAMRERIERAEISDERKADLLARMDGEFFDRIKGVYFPLARFGKYVVVVKDKMGNTESVSRSETMAEAEATRAAMQKQFPSGKVSKVLLAAEFNASRDGVGRGFLKSLFNVLDEQGVSDELQDAINQLYLSSLPDLSWAKHGIHRKGTPGFSQDARRSFAQNMFHGARYLAKLRYADQLQTLLDSMEKTVKAGEEVPDFDSVKARQVVDEMTKRHDLLMNPKTNPLSTALTSIGFVFHMGLSPASAMVNLTQTGLVAYPAMGARWGFAKAGKALLTASREAATSQNDMSKTLKGDELRAYDAAVKAGTIDVTLAHDLAGIAQGEDSKVVWKMRPVMRAASFLFHHAERFNRQVTFMAAYRLARAAGAGHQPAVKQATQVTYDTHFDYSSGNRPRFMQGNMARVILLFKQFAQNQIFMFTRQAYLSLKGLTPEDRSMARKTLSGLLVMHAAGAGILGLPLVGTLLAAASFIGSGDDEPWDAEVAMRNLLAESIGHKPAEVLAHGLSRLTPFDISGRVGLDKLILPDVQEGLEGVRLAESIMASALGPVAGIGVNVARGSQKIGEGQWARGLEDMMPSALRGPLKAMRYAQEGAIDKTGIPIVDNVGPVAVLGQALGLSPSEVREATEGKSAIRQLDSRISERRRNLLQQYSKAMALGDTEAATDAREDIATFNKAQPEYKITAGSMMKSVTNRRRRIADAEDGVFLPKGRKSAREAGAFAREEE